MEKTNKRGRMSTLMMLIALLMTLTIIAGATTTQLGGTIIIDGSSTVFPITEAVAEEFHKVYPGVSTPIGVSGTGGGFKKFVIGETDISNASRPIKDSEAETAKANGVLYVELAIAYDGLSVMVSKQNDFVDSLTVEELKRIWEPESTVKTWKDVRPEWPDAAIKLYAPGTDSGTFDYFTEVITGKAGASRSDFTPSEDDNVLVQGIAGDKYSLGYFGYAYYAENTDKLKIVKIDNGNGPVEPTFDSIKDGSYAPLSRPIYMYVSSKALEQEHVRTFVEYFLREGRALVSEVGYVQMDDASYEAELAKLK
ncbi:MAG: PstS family phosphate ABC transporter substrate-binding protein [Christensenellales bacterium]